MSACDIVPVEVIVPPDSPLPVTIDVTPEEAADGVTQLVPEPVEESN